MRIACNNLGAEVSESNVNGLKPNQVRDWSETLPLRHGIMGIVRFELLR